MRLHAATEFESRNVVGSALRALNRSDEALAQYLHSLRLMPAPGVTPGHRWIVFGNAAKMPEQYWPESHGSVVVAPAADVHHAGMAQGLPPRMAMTATLADGRRMSWAEYGSADGATLVMLHGTPGSRLQFQWMHERATAAGIRLIAPE